MRSGTSAMMGALIAGGMEAEWDKSRDNLAHDMSDENYHPNPAGLYEVKLSEYSDLNFPLKYQNKLIKIMSFGMDIAANPDGYKIIMMKRNKEEISQSYDAFFNHKINNQWFIEYDERMKSLEDKLLMRKDVVSLDVINYRDLIESPNREINKLNWPINKIAAAQFIDPKQYRFRLENLTIGI